jgi:RNA polymerase sigma-70 factor, ECF subfamily
MAHVGRSTGELLLGIQSRATKYGSLLDAPSSARPMRYSSLSLKDLVCLCADPRHDEAWEEFVSRVQKPIALIIMRRVFPKGEPSRSLVEDLVQTTYVKLWKDNCRLLRAFAIEHPDDDAILRYIRKTAANTFVDDSRKRRVPTIPIDPEMEQMADRNQEREYLLLLVKEIDEHLKHCLTGPDQKRDRMIFWLYFRWGMSTKEIASLPTIGLTAKGVGSVIERLKRCLRERILGLPADSEDDKE